MLRALGMIVVIGVGLLAFGVWFGKPLVGDSYVTNGTLFGCKNQADLNRLATIKASGDNDGWSRLVDRLVLIEKTCRFLKAGERITVDAVEQGQITKGAVSKPVTLVQFRVGASPALWTYEDLLTQNAIKS